MEKDPLVGKTHSVVDYVKRVNRVLHDDNPAFERVPDSADEIAQYLFLFSMSAKPSDLNNVVDYPFQEANLVVQLKSWDVGAMRGVIERANAYLRAHPCPERRACVRRASPTSMWCGTTRCSGEWSPASCLDSRLSRDRPGS